MMFVEPRAIRVDEYVIPALVVSPVLPTGVMFEFERRCSSISVFFYAETVQRLWKESKNRC